MQKKSKIRARKSLIEIMTKCENDALFQKSKINITFKIRVKLVGNVYTRVQRKNKHTYKQNLK